MSSAPRVVINAAGRGTRLGIDLPKALLQVEGRTLVEWQFSMLDGVQDVHVVVGFRGDDVERVVHAARPDATIVRNDQYATTGTAASLVLGARGAEGAVLSLDCDLVVHPADLGAMLAGDVPALGVLPLQSLEPVTVRVEERGGHAVALSFDGPRRLADPPAGLHEWSGLTIFDPVDPRLGPDQGHVFRLIEPLLPMRAVPIRAVEVDYPEEVEPLARWVRQLMQEGVVR